MRWVFLAVFVFVCASLPASAAPWRIAKTEWNADDEKGFGDFVNALGQSGCKNTVECLRSTANPYRSSDPKSLKFLADCADFPYMLRAYYAWKNGLPFAYVDGVSGGGDGDIRFVKNANRPVSRRALVDRGDGLNAVSILDDIHNGVSSATYRTDMGQQGGVLSDFYAPRMAPESIKRGSVIYDVNGHVGIVYDIDGDGRISYMDAHPDFTVTRSVFGAQFGQSPARLGGGLKNWRPLTLVGARQRRDGTFTGGRIVLAANDEIADFSLEQYRGNMQGTSGDGDDARFSYNGVALGFYEYVRVAVSGGKMSYNPVYELRATMRTLCNDLRDRALFVDIAIKDGIDRKAQPSRMPDNIYGTDSLEWETYSTPSRDARIKTGFAALYADLARMVYFWEQRDPRIVYDGLFLRDDLRLAYAEEDRACVLHYTNSAGGTVTLNFDRMKDRLFAMGFDPYHCIERRWGAQGAELNTCKDNETKRRWYEAEQRLRNQIDRTYDVSMDFSLSELQAGGPRTGKDGPPSTDIKALIDTVGVRAPFTGMKPVGE